MLDLTPIRQGSTAGLSRLHDEMDNLFERFFGDRALRQSDGRTWWPALDISEREDAVVIRAEVPGMKPEDIDISVHDQTVIITGEKKEAVEAKEETYHRVERAYGTFRREVTLPTALDTDKVKATYKDGVLEVRLPKSEAAKPKRVEVTGE